MKTKLFFLFFITLSLGVKAQGDLQFNQVLTFTTNSDQSNIYTVPAGKVAKITKALENRNGTPTYDSSFTINGHQTASSGGNYYNGLDGMWLKSGDIVGSTYYTGGYLVISIIEYNIITP